MNITVSLLITTYNWKEALRLTLQSVFTQTLLPTEIIIGDDGSREDTRMLIDEMRKQSPVPIIHVWHEDVGFRLTMIRNKAIARATGDYIVQVDGDVILERHFIEDHVEMAEPEHFVCGSRVKIFKEDTARILAGKKYNLRFYNQNTHSMLNGMRSRFVRNWLAKRYAQKDIAKLRGCNMAFWRKDLIEVNGYNEDLVSWGHEDSELAYRLIFSGKKKKFLKMGGILYHLHHASSNRDNEPDHIKEIQRVKSERRTRCENGLANYL